MTKPGIRKAAKELLIVHLAMAAGGVDSESDIRATHDMLRALGREPQCRKCGCTEDRACPGGCSWVAPNLCSKCEGT
jgi:hypothetical protein